MNTFKAKYDNLCLSCCGLLTCNHYTIILPTATVGISCIAIERMLIIEYKTKIAPGSELEFKPNAIKHESERNTASVNYVTGKVTVVAHPDEVCAYFDSGLIK